MTVLGYVEVLELRLQVDAAVLNCNSVLIDVVEHLLFFLLGAIKVLASRSNSILLGDRLDSCHWVFVDALLGEREVDGCAEVLVVEPSLLVVLLRERVELLGREREVEHGEHRAELGHSHAALAQFVEVAEELFDAHALHHNQGLETLLHVRRVVRDEDCRLKEAVLEDIDITSRA